jgi:hypothetical protein
MNDTPLESLKAGLHNSDLPLSVRLRAAIEAAPYAYPKLSVTAFLPAGSDFAKRLEKAIARSREVVRLIEQATSVAK